LQSATHKELNVIKPLSIALAFSLATAGTAALADDTSSMSASHMQHCIAKEKAKNDGRSDAQISQACTTKMQQKYQNQSSNGNSMNDMQSPGTTPSAATPNSPTYPNNTTPNETNQTPK
jgi:hypothetical protein